MPDGNNREITLQSMTNLKGETMDVAPGSGHQVRISVQNIDVDKMLIAKFL